MEFLDSDYKSLLNMAVENEGTVDGFGNLFEKVFEMKSCDIQDELDCCIYEIDSKNSKVTLYDASLYGKDDNEILKHCFIMSFKTFDKCCAVMYDIDFYKFRLGLKELDNCF